MVGIGRSLVIVQVTIRAIRRYGADPALVARRAILTAVAARERETLRMDEGCPLPCRRAVTLRAIGREAGHRMVGIGGALIVIQVTRGAVGG